MFVVTPNNMYAYAFSYSANVTQRNCDAYYAGDGKTYLISASLSDVKGQNSVINIFYYDDIDLTLVTTLTNNSFNT